MLLRLSTIIAAVSVAAAIALPKYDLGRFEWADIALHGLATWICLVVAPATFMHEHGLQGFLK